MMSDNIKDKVAKAGHKVAETATKVGHKISEGAEKATDWAKEKLHQAENRTDEAAQKVKHAAQETFGTAKPTADIREHMEVIASCGKPVGVVDRVEGNSIKLTKNGPLAGGKHHLIPLDWVAKVDQQVHLDKNSEETMQAWQEA
jgi:hypothetical protein